MFNASNEANPQTSDLHGLAPLSGIRVIDFSAMIAGPYCTRLLADCGAEVIKIEPPGGDQMRLMAPLRDGQSAYFGHLNAGKKSVVLNLKNAADHAQAIELIKGADIVVENFRPGVMDGLKLNYATLAQHRPDLIYCAISGFGQTGPRCHEPAYAPIVHAASGFDMAQLDYQDELTVPEKSGIFVADVLASLYAYGSIQSALIGRLRHGIGRFIDIALIEGMINLLIYECQAMQFPQAARRLLYTPTRTIDGFVIIAPISQKNFEEMAQAMGHPEWKNDSRFEKMDARRNNWLELTTLIEAWTSQRTARECEETLAAAGIPCSRYKSLAEATTDPQSVHRQFMATVNDAAGPFLVPNPPFRFDDASVHVRSQVPALGQHTEDILSSISSSR